MARLEGPELARRVTPSVAYLKVTIGSAKKNSLVLEYSSSHSTTKRRKDGRAVIGGSVSRPQSDHGRLMVDDFGSILFAESSKDTLPYGLGPLSHLAIEPLSPKGESSWATRRLTTITHTQRDQSRYDPFSRFGSGSPFRSRSRSRFGPRGIPRPPSPFDRGGSEVKKVYLAMEIAAYELAETNPQTQVISKHYDFRTIDDSDKPHVRLYGDGNIRFDRSKRLCDQISFHLNLEVRGDDGKSALVPVEVFCERLTDQELDERNRRTADLVKKSQQQAQARAAMTIDDHLAAITDPNKSSSEKYYSLSRLKTTTPNDQKRKAVLDAVKPNLDSKDALVRNGSIDVFGRWATEAEAKALIDLVTHADTSVRFSAIRALGKIGGAKAASALVGRLTVSTDGSVAASALQKMGEIVEDPVLKLIDHPDERVRYQVYRILGKVGGAKSLAALKKKSEPHTVYRAVANASMQEIGRRLEKMN